MEQTQQEVKAPDSLIDEANGLIDEVTRLKAVNEALLEALKRAKAAPALLAALKRAKARDPRCLRDQVGASKRDDCNCVTCAIDAAIALAEAQP